MLLIGRNGDRFELKIAGYEFPRIESEDYDSNWLRVGIDVHVAGGSWRSVDPSLLTWEAALLADWLEAIAKGEEVERQLEFIEPNLSFELVDRSRDRIVLRVWFELEARPAWAPWDEVPARDLCAELDVTRSEVNAAAGQLRTGLRRFPERGVTSSE